jgi:xylulokinase
VKAVLFERNGAISLEGEGGYPTRSSSGGREEQFPDDWRTALRSALAPLADEIDTVELIVLAGTMQGVIPTSGEGKALGPAILYSDSRASEEFSAVSHGIEALGGADLIGNVPNPYMSAFKIEWLRRHEPDLFAKVATFHSGAKDFIGQWLTGARVTDPTNATTVGLMDLKAGRWDPRLLELFSIRTEQMPEIRPASFSSGMLLKEPADWLGLRPGTPVLNGCGDAGASTLGAGISREGETYIYVGTSAWAAQITADAAARPDQPSIYTLAHPDQDARYIRIGAMLSGGDSAAWYAEIASRSLRELDEMISAPEFLPSDALFLPYLKGERCPFTDPDVRGSFLFLDRSDRAAHLHHAVLEGIALAIAANVASLGPVMGDIALLGGGGVSDHLPQLIADACGRTVEIADRPAAATSFGAFKVAAETMGWTVHAPASRRIFEPRPDAANRMVRRRALFEEATACARSLAWPDR